MGREHHWTVGDGRLQHAAGGDPGCATSAVHSGSGALEPGRAEQRPHRPARGVPRDGRTHAELAAERDQAFDDEHRRTRLDRGSVAWVLVLGLARHGVQPRVWLSVAAMASAEAVRSADAGGRARVHGRHCRGSRGPEHPPRRGVRPAVRLGPGERPRVRDLARDRSLAAVRVAIDHLQASAESADAVARCVARRAGRDDRDGHDRLRLSDLPVEHLHDRALRHDDRVHPDHADLVLPAGADHPGGCGDQRAAAGVH